MVNESRQVPFDKGLRELSPSDLQDLTGVHEGWYVEYKRQAITQGDLSKSLSAFANQYGGWLFIGVAENRETNTAESFPGIPTSSIPAELERLRNAAKDTVRPSIFYEHIVIDGPVDSIGLADGKSIIVVNIPQGADTPYFHTNGRIYRRVGDSSTPVHISDRAELDLLSEHGRIARSRLEDKVSKLPEVSKGEENTPFLHIHILSDPYEIMGHRYRGRFSDFAAAMAERMLPFDNIFPTTEGFVARQVQSNREPHRRLLTWELSLNCDSFITVPINVITNGGSQVGSTNYSTLQPFLAEMEKSHYGYTEALDLEQLLVLLMTIVVRHRRLAGQANIKGPFYVKARLENMWRRVPFIDVPEFLKHISEFGFPLIQQADIFAPSGTSLDSFVVWPERDTPLSGDSIDAGEIDSIIPDMIAIGRHVFYAAGIPSEIILSYAKTMAQKYFVFNSV